MNARFEIIVLGHIQPHWADEFDGVQISLQEDGNSLITGYLPDQSALFGLLLRLRDFGMTLVSVNQIKQHSNDSQGTEEAE